MTVKRLFRLSSYFLRKTFIQRVYKLILNDSYKFYFKYTRLIRNNYYLLRQSGGDRMTRKELKALRRTKAVKKKQNINKAQSAAAMVAASAVLATSNISAQIEEIVVTSRKKEETLQDVPLQVSTLTEESLEASGINTFEDYLLDCQELLQEDQVLVKTQYTFVALLPLHLTLQLQVLLV